MLTVLPNKEFRELVPKLREKGFYKPKEQRKISWPEYNLSQINEAKDLLSFIRNSVDSCRLLYHKKAGRPLTNPKALAKAILVCELLGLPERQAQGWLEILGPFLGINITLDDRVIGNAYSRPEVGFILKQVFEKTKNSDGILSGDGTGIENSRKQNYESNKRTSDYMVSIVDSREIVQAFELEKSEHKAIKILIEQVKGDSLRLDAGFVDRELTRRVSELGMTPFIFPKKNLKLNLGMPWQLMYLDLFFETQEWLREYHQRSHTESFHSMKINPISKLTQITARIIIHNFRKLSYYKLTIS